ncbi:DcrB-related protein [Aquisphaera insulae]|uniref:DcrB-related protein n=1 Tax=Aquisphaera insulae TaxID=2712864 RepID=UPI0013EAFD6D|nr:DcrB-related protein [Aquisphaera insulae]
MKSILMLVCVVSVASSSPWAAAQQADESRRLKDEAGKFSFVPPPKWTTRSFPGAKYQIVHGPPKDGFAPNINVIDEPFGGSMEQYAKASLATLEKALPEFKLKEQREFKTKSGLQGVRLVSESAQNKMHLRQTFYLFGRGEKKYVVTCSALAEGGADLDKTFEQALKTFQIED